jgi:hypothetical protein
VKQLLTGYHYCYPPLLMAVSNFLGVPKLDSGTGNAAAQAVHEQLQSWHCESLVVGMCFDTTAANIGKFSGAYPLLEGKLGRSLL